MDLGGLGMKRCGMRLGKEELGKRYAGDENQPEYLAFIAGWNAAIERGRQEFMDLVLKELMPVNEIHNVENELKSRMGRKRE